MGIGRLDNKQVMTESIGPQYPKDRQADPTGFLESARAHQSRFRAEKLRVPCDRYGNYLLEEDARKGLNFYQGFGILEAAKKRYPTYSRSLFANMLRSEHVPLNLFVPLNSDDELRRAAFSAWLGYGIRTISELRIEHAPAPRSEYLNDRTSFDAYVEYEDEAGLLGLVGIEVKYTEREYALTAGSKEDRDLTDRSASYFRVMNSSGIYHSASVGELVTDVYRQIWRNQLLGESILQRHREQYAYATLMVVYPSANLHMARACEGYRRFLVRPDDNFKALTYEQFISDCRKTTTDPKMMEWLNYLEERYTPPMSTSLERPHER